MLIRLDVYPTNDDDTPSVVLHGCLSTVKDDNGLLFEIGRKAGDVTFPLDKSVSRQHCLMRLITNETARNNDERKSVEKSPLQMCLVLENQGKGGCFVATTASTPKNNFGEAENSSDNEETDEEGISETPSQRAAFHRHKNNNNKNDNKDAGDDDLPDISKRTKALLRNDPSIKLQKLLSNDQTVLPLLPNQPLPIQCGRFESTIALTYIPLEFATSRLSSKQAAFYNKPSTLQSIGAVKVAMPTTSTTHLITSSRVGGAKQLIAWCRGIHIVTPQFGVALQERTKCTDPIPLPTDHLVPITDSKNNEFWENQPNPSLLQAYTLLSPEKDPLANEIEQLALAGGVAKLVSVADCDTQSDFERIAKKHAPCFAVSSNKRAVSSMRKAGIHLVKAKVIATCITKQDPNLTNENGEVIPTHNNDSEDDRPDDDDDEIDVVDESEHEEDILNITTDTKPAASPPPAVSSAASKKTSPPSPPPRNVAARNSVVEMSDDEEEGKKEQEPPKSKTNRPVGKSDEVKSSTRGPHDGSYGDDNDDAGNSNRSPVKSAPEIKNDNENSKISSNPIHSQPIQVPSRPRQKVTSYLGNANKAGWYQAPPQDLRKGLRIKAEEARQDENGGLRFIPAAPTQCVATLIVKRNALATTTTSTAMSRQGRKKAITKGGPDFKKFCKNSVQRTSLRKVISLRAVLPKETEQQLKWSEQQRELEEQQRLADELFRDPSRLTGARKRRKL